jgi:hypothetical protein
MAQNSANKIPKMAKIILICMHLDINSAAMPIKGRASVISGARRVEFIQNVLQPRPHPADNEYSGISGAL